MKFCILLILVLHISRAFDSLSKESDVQKRQLPQIPVQANSASSIDCIPNRQERMQSLREQHQRMHQKRQGHYPLDQKEEYYENELKEKESKYVSLITLIFRNMLLSYEVLSNKMFSCFIIHVTIMLLILILYIIYYKRNLNGFIL